MGDKAPEWLATDVQGIARAADLLRSGRLVAVPTETVYGLAARANSEQAVAEVFRAKRRPDFNPLIVHVPSLAAGRELARFDASAELLAERFWPGPLTLVLPSQPGSGIVSAVTAGLATIALRMPAHPATLALLEQTGLPLAAPSANRSGGVSPTTPQHVAQSLGPAVSAILDGGPCARGLESSIVALREDGSWHLLRQGPITEEGLVALLGAPAPLSDARIEAPGQLARHYSPGKPLRLGVSQASDDEFLVGFGLIEGDCSLSRRGDLAEAAARVCACLHEAAASDKPRIAVAPVPQDGIGAALNDRLQRAAA